MTIEKTFEIPQGTIHFTVHNEHTFTDKEGKEHQINELWFFDPHLVVSVAGEERRGEDVASWFYNNRAGLKEFTRVNGIDRNKLNTSFDTIGSGVWELSEERLARYIASRSVPDYRLDGTASRACSGGDDGDFLLLKRSVEDEVSKPTFYIRTMDGDLHCLLALKEAATGPEATPETLGHSHSWFARHSYSFKMDKDQFNFFRRTKRDSPYTTFFGLELEVNTQLTSREIQKIVTEVEPKQEPFFIFKEDSSVSGKYSYNVELVTVPCTPNYLKRNFQILFKKMEDLCAKQDMELGEVFDMRRDLSNGLHIHVSNDSFYFDLHRRKFLTAFNQYDSKNVDFLTKISGRPQKKFTENGYCSISSSLEGRTIARRLKKNLKTGDRAVCHNNNSATMEVRVFQGIVDITHILRCIEFTEAMFEFTSQVSIKSFGRNFYQDFKSFVQKAAGFKKLKEQLECA